MEEDRNWLNRSETRSVSVDYGCPKLVCTAEEVDGSMSDLYFQEEILLDWYLFDIFCYCPIILQGAAPDFWRKIVKAIAGGNQSLITVTLV